MVFRGAELEYDNFELIRGQINVIKVTQRSKTAGNITIACNTTLCSFFWVTNSMEAYFFTLEVNTMFRGQCNNHHQHDHQLST